MNLETICFGLAFLRNRLLYIGRLRRAVSRVGCLQGIFVFIYGVKALSAAKQAFWCTHRDGYSVVAFPAELSRADMSDIRDAGVKVQEHLSQKKCAACVVDLSALDYIGSSMVALIVKIWKLVKAQGGRVVVVAPRPNIRDVLRIAGLTKVWTITDTFEAAVHSLGCSTEAKVEKRERRLLTFVGPLALIGAAVCVAGVVAPDKVPIGKPQEWMIHTLGGLSLLASLVCVFRDTGWRRVFSAIGLVLSICLAVFWFWHQEFRTPEDVVPEVAPANETLGAETQQVEEATTAPEAATELPAQESTEVKDASLLNQPLPSDPSASGDASADAPVEPGRSLVKPTSGDAEVDSPPKPESLPEPTSPPEPESRE